jgi:putative phosphoserine phosphatase/1-acylglycerol-3-phosphate O-acyltransferase
VRPGTVHVEVLEPIATDAWTLDTLDAHIAEVRALYLARLGE